MYPHFFDAHCDTASVILDRKEPLFENTCHIDLKRLSAYQSPIICFAAFIAPEYRTGGYARYRAIVDNLKKQIAKNSDKVMLCKETEDIARASDANKVSAILTVEGGEALGGDIARLKTLKADGVKAMTLTWNGDNDLATGCATTKKTGLTKKGIDAVHYMNKLGILVDVSHASEQTFWDIAETTKKPIIASHSDSKAVYKDASGRNLSDEQFLAICKLGGVCGINLYSPFLAAKDATMHDIIAHMEHYLALGGEDHVGFGFDFDGIAVPPRGISGVEDVYQIMNELARLGYADALLQKIFYGNFMRVFGFCS